MKRILFGSAAAIVAVVGFSAFKNPKSFTTSYYWFEYNTLVQPTTFDIFAANGSLQSTCDGTGAKCEGAFTIAQLTSTHHEQVKTSGGIYPAPNGKTSGGVNPLYYLKVN